MSKKKISIHVGILEARGLAPTNFFGTADTYCVLTLDADSKQLKDQTAPQNGTLEPKWEHNSSFSPITKASTLTVALRNAETHDALGSVSFKAAQLKLKDGKAASLDEWLPLEKEADMQADAVGELHVTVRIDSAKKDKDKTAKAKAMAAGDDSGGAGAGHSPNLLRVEIVQARGVRANDTNFLGADSSDPFAELSCNGQTHRTKVIEKTLTPVWEETCEFSVSDAESELTVLVYDQEMMSQPVLLGQLRVPLSSVPQASKSKQGRGADAGGAAIERRWFKLVGERMEDGDHGEVELGLQWLHDAETSRTMRAAGGASVAAGAVVAGSSAGDFEARRAARRQGGSRRKAAKKGKDGAEGSGGASAGQGSAVGRLRRGGGRQRRGGAGGGGRKGLSAEEREKAQAEARAELARLREVEAKLVTGDYQVQAHIIECRNLKGEDVNGSCDPVVTVEVLGQKQNTSIKNNMRDPVFDEVLFFNLKNVDKEQLKGGSITVSCYDADSIGRNDMVGSHTFDLMSVYLREEHELYRTWVALVDLEEEDDHGAQGYMKLSITVLGPGDTQAVHNVEQERKAEQAAEKEAGGLGGMCLMPPTIKLELEFLVVSVYAAEDLPAMDTGLMGNGTDAFVQVDFGGNPPCKTSVVTERGEALHPFFEENLWVPVMVPTMSSTVTVSVWDEDTVSDDLIGYVTGLSFKQARAEPVAPRWFNLYGASAAINSGEAAERMNRYPATASHFRGRVLLGAKVLTASEAPGKVQQLYTEEMEHELPAAMVPSVARYTLRAFLLRGSELPTFSVGSNKLSVKVCIGGHELSFPQRANKTGDVEWGELQSAVSIELPADIEQVPDVFVYLCAANMTGEGSSDIAYARFKVADLIADKFKAPTSWHTLCADPCVGTIGDGVFPGALLMKLGFGLDGAAQKVSWEAEVNSCDEMVPYQLRVHVYQGRNLPALDDEGTLDPYVIAKFGGKAKQTRTRMQSCFPLWYQTLEFDVHLPETLSHAPQVTLECWDWDQLTPDEIAGTVRVPMSQAVVCEQSDTPAPRPKWIALRDPAAEAGVAASATAANGELLVSLQLVRKRELDEELPHAPPITPTTRPALVEIVTVGLRDLEPYGFMNVQMPWIELDLCGGDDAESDESHHQTQPSRSPNGTNPNFLEHAEIECDLPDDPLFAPQLALKVFDTRLGGFQTPLVATGAVDLSTKLPWNKDGYIPPQQQGLHVREKPKHDPGLLGEVEDGEDESKDRESKRSKSKSKKKKDKDKKKKDKKDKGSSKSGGSASEAMGSPWVEQTFLEGRDWWVKSGAKELEEFLRDAPFETYELFRGQGEAGMLSLGRRVCGKLKGVIRVTQRGAAEDEASSSSKKSKKDKKPLFDMAKLERPKPYCVRVYVTMAFSLQPMDWNGLSDPYLKLRLGETEIDDCANYLSDTVDPEFYKCFELKAELPGASQLEVEVWDHDDFMPDDMIGKTVVDLEDRLFHKGWNKLGKDHEKAKEEGPLKPVETRSLWSTASNNPQGRLQMWVELLTPEEAKSFPKLKGFEPPKAEEFEVQVVCWKSKDVMAMDSGNMNDLYGVFFMEGGEPQETDTHWRCYNGEGSWNWRLKFPITLPMKPEQARLHVQLWDRDVVKWNDVICESTFDLYDEFIKAYKRKKTVRPFAEKKQAAMAERRKTGISAGRRSRVSIRRSVQSPIVASPAVSEDDDDAPLLGDGSGASDEVAADEDNKANAFIGQLKGIAGVGDLPDDAEWLTLYHQDEKTQQLVEGGRVAVSIQICTKREVEARPNGFGRDDPNSNPFLPPPVGRMQMSLNPLNVLKQLLGPEHWNRFCCCVMCVLVFIAAALLGSLFGPFITILK